MTDTNEITTATLTPEIVKGKMLIALTKAEQTVQALNDAESKLVYNEDNLLEISKFINGCKQAEKIVEDERKAMKEPFLQSGRAVDDGAKLVSTDLVALRNKATTQYTKLANEVEKKRKAAEAEKQRVDGIRKQMNDFKIEYSGKIAAATTDKELVAIERLINLETGNKTRYMEFLPEFATLCEPIRALIKAQKETVRQLAILEDKRKEAEKTGSDEAVLEIMEKTEGLQAKIAENRDAIQTEAVNQAVNSGTTVTEIIPELPKGGTGRKYYKWEMVDEKAATRNGYTKVVPDEEKIEEYFKSVKKENITEEGFTQFGIRIYLDRRF